MSLNKFLTRLIWLCIAPLMLVAVYLSIDAIRATQSELDRTATRLAGNVVSTIDQDLNARIRSLRMLASSPLATDDAYLKDLYQEAQSFRESFGSHVVLSDSNMNMLFNTRVPFGSPLPKLPRPKGHAAAPTALKTGKPAVGDLFFGPIAKQPLVAIAVPGKRNEKTTFLLLNIFETSQFQTLIDEVSLPSGWRLTLFDGSGEPIARHPAQGNKADRDNSSVRFIARSMVSPWSVEVEIPRDIYNTQLIELSAGLAMALLIATLAGIVGGRLAGRRLARSVAMLATTPLPDAPPSGIAEVDAARHRLDELEEKRTITERLLRDNEKELRLAADGAPVMIAHCDRERRYKYVNLQYAKFYGMHPADIIGKHPSEVLDPAAYAVASPYMDAALAGQTVTYEITLHTPSSGSRTLLAYYSPQPDASGHPVGFIAAIYDITERKQAETALRESERNLTEAQRIAHVGSWRWNLTGPVQWTDEMYRVYGVSPDTFTPTIESFFDLVYPEDRPAMQEWLRACSAGESPADFEFRAVRPDGTVRFISGRGELVRDAGGRPIQMVGTALDITERKQAEAALRESEVRLRNLIDGLGPEMFVGLMTPGGTLIEVNRPALAAAGLKPEDVLGKPVEQSYWWSYSEELQQQLHATVARAARGEPSRYDARVRVGENQFIYIDFSLQPLRDETGKVQYLVGSANVITERKRAEEALAESERLHRLLLDSLTQRIFYKDRDSVYIACNASYARDLGIESATIVGRNDYEFHPTELAERYRADDLVVMESGRMMELEEPFRNDGEERWVHTVKTPMHDSAGDITGVLGIFWDVTERKRAEQERRDALDRLQKQFVALGKATTSESLLAGDIQHYARELTELGAKATGAERVNVWLFNEDETELQCIDLYEATPARHSAGTILTQQQLAHEFASLKSVRYVDADDPLTDPRTAGYVEGYLKPLRITSMLDAIIQHSGKHLGLICFEHVDKPHHWETDEIAFATQFADKLGLALINQAREQSQVALKRANRALRALSGCNTALIHAESEIGLLGDVCQTIVEAGGYRMAWIGYVEHDEARSIRPLAHAGFETGYLEAVLITWADTEHGQGPTGRAVRSGMPQVARDIQHDPKYAPWREQALKRGYASSNSLPLKEKDGEVFGVLNVYAAETDAFGEEEIGLLQELADDLAFGVDMLRTRDDRDRLLEEQLKSSKKLKETLTDTIRAVALTVEKRDPYTAGHQQRVAELCVAIGRELGLDEDRLEGLRLGATIHDIGKIYVPAEILNRPGRLSNAEFEIIKTHPQVGYDIIKDVHLPWPVAQMILQHHERLDGSGYPNGLKDKDIILEARILTVADVVEAMASHRPYRPGLGIEAALDEIGKNRGRLYDPAAADACQQLFREQGFAWSGT